MVLFSGYFVLKFAIAALCTGCFLALCWDQMLEFVAKKRGVSHSWIPIENRQFPLLTFCPKYPYGKHIVDLYGLVSDREKYNQETANFTVTFRGKILSDYIFLKEKVKIFVIKFSNNKAIGVSCK